MNIVVAWIADLYEYYSRYAVNELLLRVYIAIAMQNEQTSNFLLR